MTGDYATIGPRDYAPTRAHEVRILETAPEGATRIGTVEGIEGVFNTAVDDCRSLAAEIGADAIVVTGRSTMSSGGMFPQRLPSVLADAYRLGR